MHKALSKDAFQDKVQTNFYHPPGTYSSVKRTKQCVDACEGTGKNMLREEGSSPPGRFNESKTIIRDKPVTDVELIHRIMQERGYACTKT